MNRATIRMLSLFQKANQIRPTKSKWKYEADLKSANPEIPHAKYDVFEHIRFLDAHLVPIFPIS